MPPRILRKRRSLNERRRRVATREGSKWQHATFWRNHDERGERGEVEYIGGQVPSEDHAAVSAAVAAVLASSTEVEDGDASPWLPFLFFFKARRK